MCQIKPLPRCSDHAKKAMDAAEARYDKILLKYKDDSSVRAQRIIDRARLKLDRAIQVYHESPAGQKALEAEIAELGEDSERSEPARKALREALARRANRVANYHRLKSLVGEDLAGAAAKAKEESKSGLPWTEEFGLTKDSPGPGVGRDAVSSVLQKTFTNLENGSRVTVSYFVERSDDDEYTSEPPYTVRAHASYEAGVGSEAPPRAERTFKTRGFDTREEAMALRDKFAEASAASHIAWDGDVDSFDELHITSMREFGRVAVEAMPPAPQED